MVSVTCLCKNNFSSVPGENLVPEPPGKGAQDQQEEAPAAGLFHYHTHTSDRQQRQCRRRRRWRRSPRKRQCRHGDKQQRQQRASVPFIPAFEHQRGVLRMFYWTLVSGNWTKNSPQWNEELFASHPASSLKAKACWKCEQISMGNITSTSTFPSSDLCCR